MLNVPIPANDIHFEYFSCPSMWETNQAISEWLSNQESNVFILDIIYEEGIQPGPANTTVIFYVQQSSQSA